MLLNKDSGLSAGVENDYENDEFERDDLVQMAEPKQHK